MHQILAKEEIALNNYYTMALNMPVRFYFYSVLYSCTNAVRCVRESDQNLIR